MPLRPRSVHTALSGAAVVFVAGFVLTGCVSTGSTPGDSAAPTTQPLDEPSASAPTDTSEFGGAGAPTPTDGSAIVVPTQAPSDGPATSEVTTLVVGNDDYSDLDWHVSCSGPDSAPTVIASADDGDTHLTLVLLGSTPTSLNSLTLSAGAPGGSSHTNSGITVNPGAGQGSGSLDVTGQTVTSTGRGLEYGPDASGSAADTIYDFSVTCA